MKSDIDAYIFVIFYALNETNHFLIICATIKLNLVWGYIRNNEFSDGIADQGSVRVWAQPMRDDVTL